MQAGNTEQSNLHRRSLKTSALAFPVLTLAFFAAGKNDWGLGFLLGSGLSLFSMVTLMLAVPFLMRPGMPRHMTALLQMTLFMKLPIFMVGLYVVSRISVGAAGASVAGISLVPTVITLLTIGDIIAEGRRETEALAEKQRLRAAQAVTISTGAASRVRRAVPAELAAETGS